ncbi:calcium-independent phospholipase A2 [Fusarium pseudoanthophilum]|uniref:Calcium-independent phospholipase A2 n=1 Tax=Fusarium pseudoanthophilum TaxID=48495 RepID=A0A8H5LEW9_9HYPO|nr:calcium-independent phospholipase A2 [Fusarium pseudoanthophilum]
MVRPREGSSISSTSDSEPEDESLIGFFEGITQSCVDPNFSDGDESTFPSTYIPWGTPSNEFIEEQAVKFQISSRCRICNHRGRAGELVFCTGCGNSKRPAHRECLARDRQHVVSPRRRLSVGEEECKEVDYSNYVFTRYLLQPPASKSKLELHTKDATCAWIGVPSLQRFEKPQIHVWPRLQDLLQMSRNIKPGQFPKLVSFIGETGSGKSTLIRTMIQMARPDHPEGESVPVPGSPSDRFASTSSDIHAYSDPLTLSTKYPIVYADCEGFVGSEKPIAQEIIAALSEPNWLFQWEFGEDSAEQRVLRHWQAKQDKLLRQMNQFLNGAESRINVEWGKLDYPDPRASVIVEDTDGRRLCTVQNKTRKLIVKYLYPRVLYGFSDVVCFVTTNGRTSDSFLGQLIDWAQHSHDRILNQRTKPALIVILNIVVDMDDSSSSDATEDLLRSFQRTERFRTLQALWKEREHPIRNTADLLLCYYSDFKVVLIPAISPRSSPADATAVSKSIRQLYETIRGSVSKIRTAKADSGTESDLATLNTHMNRSLSVLGQNLRAALDLHDVVMNDSSIPTQLSDHMASTLRQMCILREMDRTDAIGGEERVVEEFAPYIGACIVAQTRHIQDNEIRKRRREDLVTEARSGLQKFRWRYWRCEALERRTGRRCRNYYDGHYKGHQFNRPDNDFEDVEGLNRRGASTGSNCTEPARWSSHGKAYLLGEDDTTDRTTKPEDMLLLPEDAAPRVLSLDGGGVRGIVELCVLRQIEKHVGYGIAIHQLFDLVVGTSTDEQSNDFKIWEAARATSAAPTFFQPFVHPETKRTYVDGALMHNNPVSLAYSEVDKIWPGSLPPDIILSIGTGLVVDPKSGKMKTKHNSKLEHFKRYIPRGYLMRIEAGLGIIQSSTSCHEAWKEFRNMSVTDRPLRQNCHRLNVGLKQRVEMDDVEKMDSLIEECEEYLCDGTNMFYYDKTYRTAPEHLQTVARRLLASLFYYVGPLERTMKRGKCVGKIFCRLEAGSASAKELLRDNVRFRLAQISEDGTKAVYPRILHHRDSPRWDLRDLSALMVLKVEGGTCRRCIEVNLPDWRDEWEPISGFQSRGRTNVRSL